MHLLQAPKPSSFAPKVLPFGPLVPPLRKPFLSNSGYTTLTAALLDRLLHHAHIVPIAGESYRLKHQRQAGMVRGNEIAEIA
jgi:hypothetical protein